MVRGNKRKAGLFGALTCLAAMCTAGTAVAQTTLSNTISGPESVGEILQYQPVTEVRGTVGPAGRVDRGSPPLGGGCQVSGVANGLIAVGAGPAAVSADNFNLQSGGVLNQISWSGVYVTTAGANGTPPATETFRVRFLADAAGVPGAVAFGPFTLTTGTNIVRAANGTIGDANYTVQDYTATFPAPPNLPAAQCLWLEIQNTAPGTGQNYFWVTSTNGDTVSYTDTTPATPYSIFDQQDGAVDLTWCLSLQVNPPDGTNCPIADVPEICSQPDANCQAWDDMTTGNATSSIGATFFSSANNFTVAAGGGSVTGGCVWGLYAGQVAAPVNEGFRIRYFTDSGQSSPGTQIAEFFVGGATPSAGTTFTAGADPQSPFLNIFEYSFTHPAVNLNAGCHWIEVVNTTTTQWVWLQRPVSGTLPGTDGYFVQRPNNVATYTPGHQIIPTTPRDLAMCLSLALQANTSCPPIPPAPNDTCATAQALTIGAAPVTGQIIRASADTLPTCGFSTVAGAAVWYSVLGNGNEITVSTCHAGTEFDTVLSVFCSAGAGCAGPFNCVAGNDAQDPACTTDGPNADASTISFPSVAGTTYFVVVSGFELSAGNFQINAVNGGVATNPPACATFARCELSGVAANPLETEACFVPNGTNELNGTCATANNYPAFGQTAGGTISTTNPTVAFRDIDLWRLPVLAAPTTLTIVLNAEFPALIQFQTDGDNNCATDNTVVAGSGAIITYCVAGDVAEITLPAGQHFLNVTSTDFGGLPCGTGNDYRFSLTVTAMGACCLPDDSCESTTELDCDGQGGTFEGANTVCSTDPCGAPTCRADFNNDGTVNVSDIFAFLSAWFAQAAGSDFDNSGVVNVSDIFAFLSAWFAGCP